MIYKEKLSLEINLILVETESKKDSVLKGSWLVSGGSHRHYLSLVTSLLGLSPFVTFEQ